MKKSGSWVSGIAERDAQSSRGGEGGSEGGSGTRSWVSIEALLCTASSFKARTVNNESALKIEFQCLSLRSFTM